MTTTIKRKTVYRKVYTAMEMVKELRGEVIIVTLSGRVDAESSPQLKKDFQSMLNSTAQVVINMQGVEYIDSTGLGALVACLKYAVELKGNVKLSSLQSKPRLVFEITRAHKIFDIYDSLDEAIESY